MPNMSDQVSQTTVPLHRAAEPLAAGEKPRVLGMEAALQRSS